MCVCPLPPTSPLPSSLSPGFGGPGGGAGGEWAAGQIRERSCVSKQEETVATDKRTTQRPPNLPGPRCSAPRFSAARSVVSLLIQCPILQSRRTQLLCRASPGTCTDSLSEVRYPLAQAPAVTSSEHRSLRSASDPPLNTEGEIPRQSQAQSDERVATNGTLDT